MRKQARTQGEELDPEFTTTKSNNSLVVAEFITDLPTGLTDPPLNGSFPDEGLFTISSDS